MPTKRARLNHLDGEDPLDVYPLESGKFLTNNGTRLSWADAGGSGTGSGGLTSSLFVRNDVSQSQTMVGPLQVASDLTGPDTTVINAGMLATLQSDLVSYTGNERDLTTTTTPKTLQKTIFYGSSVSPAGDNCLCTVKTVDDAVLAQTVHVDAVDAQVMSKTPITATDSDGNPYTAGQKLAFPWLEIFNDACGVGYPCW